jgi:hypothetical protein
LPVFAISAKPVFSRACRHIPCFIVGVANVALLVALTTFGPDF